MIGIVSAVEPAEPGLAYRCPKCGDRFDCVTRNDEVIIVMHRALHLAVEQNRSSKRVWRAS